jgi:3-hydroxyisobutyrate dehydrogenase-like beta-hydroxyacid dehydrogenase
VGLGSVVKLINQLLVGVHTQAACEAMALGAKAGVDPAQVMAVLGSSWGSSGMLTRTAPIIASGDYGSRAPMRLIAKDLGLVAELAAEVGLDLPVTRRTHDAVEAAVGQGLAETDIAALYTLLVK